MKKIYFFIISFLPLFAFAQPTLTQSDLPTAGTGWSSASDSAYVDVIPAGGAGVTWDYSGLQNKVTDSAGFSAAGGTPYASIFTTSNLASYDWSTGDWSYYTTNSSGLYVNGFVTMGTTVNLNPPLLYAPVPFTYNNTRNSVARFVIDTMYSGFCGRLSNTITSDFIADGWGTLQIPTGTYNNVLRIKITEVTADSTLLDLTCTGNYSTVIAANASQITRYMYFRSGSVTAYLLSIDADSAGTTSTSSEYYLSSLNGVSVNDLASVNNNLVVYPNPANDMIHFNLEGNRETNSVINIYDATGRSVYNGSQETLSSFEVPLSKFENGIYYYTLTSDQNSRSGKFTVMH